MKFFKAGMRGLLFAFTARLSSLYAHQEVDIPSIFCLSFFIAVTAAIGWWEKD